MAVNSENVVAAIKGLFGKQVWVQSKGDMVTFYIDFTDFISLVTVQYSEPFVEFTGAELLQKLTIWQYLCTTKREPVFFDKVTLDQVWEVTSSLQSTTDWSVLQVCDQSDGSVIIGINRTIETGIYDLTLAANASRESEFVKTVTRLSNEMQKIAPAFLFLSQGKLEDVDHLPQLVEMDQSGMMRQ